jgi:tubby-related protein 1
MNQKTDIIINAQHRPTLNKIFRKDFYVYQEEIIPSNGLDVPHAKNVPELLEFIKSAPLIGNTIKCKIIISLTNGIICQYTLVYEHNDGSVIPILVSRKAKYSFMPTFLIETHGTHGQHVGLLEKNVFSSVFSLYENIKRQENMVEIDSSMLKASSDSSKALVYVEYESFISNIGIPIKMNVYLPGLDRNEQNSNFEFFYNRDNFHVNKRKEEIYGNQIASKPECTTPVEDSTVDLNRKKQYFNPSGNLNLFYGPVIKLTTKMPTLDKTTNTFRLNMNGRATMGSIANFQLVHEANPNYVVMQCGKLENDVFSCDFSYPINPLQAFSIALSCLFKNE